MRMTLLGLALVFATAQAVSWADCCCGSFCEHKNACTGCGPEDVYPGGEGPSAADACCAPAETPAEEVCSHLEPSSEIDVLPACDSAEPTSASIHLPRFAEFPPRPAVDGEDAFPSRAPPSGRRRHLLLSVLLI